MRRKSNFLLLLLVAFFMGAITTQKVNAQFHAVESLDGQVDAEDGSGDGDWNDIAFTHDTIVRWDTPTIIKDFSMNIQATICTATYQNRWGFLPPCNGTLRIVDVAGNDLVNTTSATSGNVLVIVDSFCGDMFENGDVGKYQTDFLRGRELDLTMMCDSGYSAPLDSDGNPFFSAADLFALDADGDGLQFGWVTSGTTELHTVTMIYNTIDDSIGNTFRHFLNLATIPLAYAASSYYIPLWMDTDVLFNTPADRQQLLGLEAYTTADVSSECTDGGNGQICSNSIRDKFEVPVDAGDLTGHCSSLKNLLLAGKIYSAADPNSIDCNVSGGYGDKMPPKTSTYGSAFPIDECLDLGENGCEFRFAQDSAGAVLNHREAEVGNSALRREVKCYDSGATLSCRTSVNSDQMISDVMEAEGGDDKRGCCPDNFNFVVAPMPGGENRCFCVDLSGGGSGSSGGSSGPASNSQENPGENCTALRMNGYTANGTYYIDPNMDGDNSDVVPVYCDMDGGWMLLLAYDHDGGSNPALVPNTTPTDPNNGLSHTSLDQIWPDIENSDLDSVRFYCDTSGHDRKIHFKQNNSNVLDIARTGSGAVTIGDWTNVSYWEALDGHNAYLPAGTNGIVTGNMTNFPFYKGGNYHWGIGGQGNRWECDDWANQSEDTLHQVWVRFSCGESGCDEEELAAVVLPAVSGDGSLESPAINCTALRTDGQTESGIYYIDPDADGDNSNAVQAYCDMNGGWMLLLAYKHEADTNPDLVPNVTPTDPDNGFSHTNLDQIWPDIENDDLDSVRFSCVTGGHNRKVNFKQNNSNVLDIARTGSGAVTIGDWTNVSYWEALDGHDAYLPAEADGIVEGNMTNFPFYKGGSYHWGVRGQGSRWECDDHPSESENTLHQVWARFSCGENDCDEEALAVSAPTVIADGTLENPGENCTTLRMDGQTESGIYYINPGTYGGPDVVPVYCDMDGAWMLLLAYKHDGGTNPPLAPDTTPTDPANGFSHNSLDQIWRHIENDDLDSVRFYCDTSGHERKIHFKQYNSKVLDIARTGSVPATSLAANDWSNVIYWEPLDGHNAYLPSQTNGVFEGSLTNFPFYNGSNYHWGVGGQGSRWECDDYPSISTSENTLHQVWARFSCGESDCDEAALAAE